MKKYGLRRSLVVAAALAVASVLSLASAQIDARARALLEGLQPATTEDLRNVDQTVVSTMFLENDETMVTTARIVIDFEGKRILMATDLGGGMTSNVVLKDGQVTMSMAGLPMKLPAPPESAAQLEQMFEQNEPVTFKEGDVATYDGVVSYGDLVSGEQVSYTTTDDAGEATTIQYLFQDGKVSGIHMVLDSGAMLVVYDAPVDSQALMGFDSTTYMLKGDAWQKFSTAHVEAIAYNVVLDDSLFD